MFKKNIEMTATINVSANKLWNVVGELEHYSGWNSATLFSSAARVGKFMLMRVKLGRMWLPVPVLIQYCDQQSGLRWIGGIPMLITGSHYFRVESLGENQSRLVQGEDFNGLLVTLLLPVLRDILDKLYSGVNADIKAYCEKQETGI